MKRLVRSERPPRRSDARAGRDLVQRSRRPRSPREVAGSGEAAFDPRVQRSRRPRLPREWRGSTDRVGLRPAVRISVAWFTLLFACVPVARAADPELVVAAAASLREPLSQVVRQLEEQGSPIRVLANYGASNVLARQIEAGAPVDVFLSADESIVDALAASRALRGETRRRLATNGVVLLVSAAVAARTPAPDWTDAQALRRIALPDEAVPLGAAGRSWLREEGVFEIVSPRLLRTDDSRATLAAVEAGHVEAAIVWSSDARASRHAIVARRAPAGRARTILVGAVTTRARDPHAAEQLLAALAGEAGRAAFLAAGFEPAPDPR